MSTMVYTGSETLTLSEAARATGVSRVTMRRYLDAGRFPNAYRDPQLGTPAPWLIPSGDLVAAGLDLASPSAPRVAAADVELAVARAVADEKDRTIRILTRELEALRELVRDLTAATRTRAES